MVMPDRLMNMGVGVWLFGRHLLRVFMLVMFSVYIPILLFTDNVQAAVMITGLVIAIGVGVLAKRPGLAWLNNFVMAFSMLGGLVSSLAWVRIFG